MELRVSIHSVQQQAAAKLRAAILGGLFNPGDRLIASNLCERLGGSRPATADVYRVMQQAGGNRLIEELLQRLMAWINLVRSQSMSQAGRAKFSARVMWTIFQAISNGDIDYARRAAEGHVSNAA